MNLNVRHATWRAKAPASRTHSKRFATNYTRGNNFAKRLECVRLAGAFALPRRRASPGERGDAFCPKLEARLKDPLPVQHHALNLSEDSAVFKWVAFQQKDVGQLSRLDAAEPVVDAKVARVVDGGGTDHVCGK